MTGEDPVWADLWDRLKVFFGALVDELRECNQRLGSDGTVLAENVPAELPDPVRRTRLFAEQDRAMLFFLDNLDLIKREVC